MAAPEIEVRIDGISFGPFDLSFSGLSGIDGLRFGAIVSGSYNDHDLDDLLVGTGGFGSSGVFLDDFSGATIVPPFDSVTGTGLSLSGGALHVFDAGGADAYAEKSFATQVLLYSQFKVRISADELANTGSFTADFLDLNDAVAGPSVIGFYYATDSNLWSLFGPALFEQFGPIVSAGTSYMIDIRVDLTPPPVAPPYVHFNDTTHFVSLDEVP